MANVTVRWRSSGGRGEFEYVPADTLPDRDINVLFEPLGVTFQAEVRGVRAQGKPRLRKFDPNNRRKLHLPQLVVAVARLPEPRREDFEGPVAFPLENKSYVMDEMNFEIIDDDGVEVTLAPLDISVKHTEVKVNLQDRFEAVARDLANVAGIAEVHPSLAEAIKEHGALVSDSGNTAELRAAADRVIQEQTAIFGATNAASAVTLEEAASLPETDIEEGISGIEGRMLTRIHSYKERDRKLVTRAKNFYRSKIGALVCEACQMHSTSRYGIDGEKCIEAHHKIPIEQLQPDSITPVSELAMVCASCHRIIHSRRPCLTIEEVVALLGPYFSSGASPP